MSRFSYLIETVVANPDAVARYCEKWAKQVRAPEAKAWLAKRLRSYILNNEALLVKLSPEDVTADMPGYVAQAAEQGQPIFQFDPDYNPHGFQNRVAHIKDFFDNLSEVSSRAPNPENSVEVAHHREAQKLLSKLQKMNFEQVEQAYEQWMARSNKQVANMSKTGCEVALTFADGYYWVRYTDLETMKRDGHDLQNCLRTGTYWSHVQDGTQAVYGLRKPNDQAVVGVRILINGSTHVLQECKGRNNEPPIPVYVPYIISLLKKLDIRNINADLRAAGVHMNGTEFGTFEDIAKTVYDQNGVKVMGVHEGDEKERFLIRVRRQQFWANSQDGQIHSFAGIDVVNRKNIVAGLNALDYPVTAHALSVLADLGIFPSENGFGSIEEVGQLLWRDELTGDQLISTLKDGSGYIFVTADGREARFTVSDSEIRSVPRNADDHAFMEAAVPGFNAASVYLSRDNDTEYLWPIGIVRTRDGYRDVNGVSTVVHKLPGGGGNKFDLLQVARPAGMRSKLFFIYDPFDESYLQYTVGDFTLTDYNTGHRDNHVIRAMTAAVQWLVEKFDVANIEADGPTVSTGTYWDPETKRYRSDFDQFIKCISDPDNLAKFDVGCELGQEGVLARTLKMAFCPSGRDKDGQLKPGVQEKIFKALKPTKDELVTVLNQENLGSWGKHRYAIMDITVPDMLSVVEAVLPRYEKQIEAVQAATLKALELFIKRNPRTVFKLKVSTMNSSNDAYYLHRDCHTLINRSNDKTAEQMKADADEKSSENPDDHFAALAALRKAGVR